MYKLVNTYTAEDSLVQYGDGVFETMLVEDNHIFHWDYHWKRLSLGCRRLGITCPDQENLIQSIKELLDEMNGSIIDEKLYTVVKMLVSRGKGLRGFASLDEQAPYVSFLTSSYRFDKVNYEARSAKYCDVNLPDQPILAGMKHCNSLTYLLAKKELKNDAYQEGLLCNKEGLVIESISANLLLLKDDVWSTPKLNQSGVAGTFRQYFIDTLAKQGIFVVEKEVTKKMIESSTSVFLTNAVQGIIPIKQIKGMTKSFNIQLPDYIFQMIDHPCLKQLSTGL